jgi:hypothetical protein
MLGTITRTATYALLNGLIQLYLKLGYYIQNSKKVIFNLEEAMKTQSGRNMVFPLISALDRGGWSTPRFEHFTPGKDQVPIVQEAGWAQGRSGLVRKLSPSPGLF